MSALLRLAAITVVFFLGGRGLAVAEIIPGPVEADVIRVVDGDTLALRARIWIGLDIVVSARIRGIDAPELHGKCDREKAAAAAARTYLEAIVAQGSVRLRRIENDKYAGRVIADVVSGDGTDIGRAMIEGGYARPYDGGGRESWCGLASLGG